MENQTIGIKLADGSFYSILEEGKAASMVLELTTVRDDQQTVQLDLYRSSDLTMDNAEYVDTLLIENLIPRPMEQPSLALKIDLDDENTLSASIEDPESGESNSLTVSLLSLDATRLSTKPDFALTDSDSSQFEFGNPLDIEDPSDIEEPVVEEELGDIEDPVAEEELGDIEEPVVEEELGDIEEPVVEEEFGDIEEPVVEEDFGDIEEPVVEEDFGDIEDSVVEETSPDFETNETSMGESNTVSENSDSDFIFKEIPPLEDIPRQNSVDSVDDDYNSEDEVQESSIDHLEEEEFPDFNDISESEENSIEPSEGEDEASFFDFEKEFKDADFDESIPAPSFSFSDLYEEKEIEEEKEEKSSKSTMIPVLICIICAIISVLALGLMFLFGPLRIKESSSAPVSVIEQENLAQSTPAPVVMDTLSVEPVYLPDEDIDSGLVKNTVEDPAKENEVVKVETEVVVPEVPSSPAVEEKGVDYKIKWGDTLWDIADAYYKNPWLYPKIARFNGIKNPDRIISGTWITIPPK